MDANSAIVILAVAGLPPTIAGAIWSCTAWSDWADKGSYWNRNQRDANDPYAVQKKLAPPLTLLSIGLLFELPLLCRLWTAVLLG